MISEPERAARSESSRGAVPAYERLPGIGLHLRPPAVRVPHRDQLETRPNGPAPSPAAHGYESPCYRMTEAAESATGNVCIRCSPSAQPAITCRRSNAAGLPGCKAQSTKVERSVRHVVTSGPRTPDLGGSASTADVTKAVVAAVAAAAGSAT